MISGKAEIHHRKLQISYVYKKVKIHNQLLAQQFDFEHVNASSLEKATLNTQMIHHECVCTSSTGHRSRPFQRQSVTQSGVAADLTDFAGPTVSTQGLIHTLGHTPRAAWPRKHRSSLLTALVREGSGPAGPFQTPSQETETTFLTGKEKPVCILPLTRPQHALNWTSSSSEVPSGDISPPAVGGQWSLWEVRSPGCWVRLPDGCGWCCGAWSLAPARDSPGRLVWEPGSLRRQTRAELCARRAERQAEARETQARASSLSWRRFHLHLPGHGSVDWQWGRVGLPEASRDGIHRLTLPEVTEERNPSMTKHELPTSNKRLMSRGPQPESGASYEGTASGTQLLPFLTLHPPKASLVPWRNSPTAGPEWLIFSPCPSPAPLMLWTALAEYNRTWEWWTILFRWMEYQNLSDFRGGKKGGNKSLYKNEQIFENPAPHLPPLHPCCRQEIKDQLIGVIFSLLREFHLSLCFSYMSHFSFTQSLFPDATDGTQPRIIALK